MDKVIMDKVKCKVSLFCCLVRLEFMGRLYRK